MGRNCCITCTRFIVRYPNGLNVTSTPVLSVVICTHSRADYLAGAVESVIAQGVDPALYELLIIDNNADSNKATHAVAVGAARDNPAVTVRYVLETTIGLSHARNRGIGEARADYIAYLDDDAAADAGWLQTALTVIAEQCPAAFGGPAMPLYTPDAPKPDWFKDSYIREADHGKIPRPLRKAEFIYGMNMAWRRDVLELLKRFDPAYGMSGSRIGYAEETVMQIRLRAVQPDALIYFHPTMRVFHVVRSEKMQWGWIVRQRFARGRYTFRARYERKGRKVRSFPLRMAIVARSMIRVAAQALVMLGRLTVGIQRRDKAAFPHAGGYIYERALRPLRTMGALYEKSILMLKYKP